MPDGSYFGYSKNVSGGSDRVSHRECEIINVTLPMSDGEGAFLFCAYFTSNRIAKRLAFRIVRPDDRSILIILTIQVFTVLPQVALASVSGV